MSIYDRIPDYLLGKDQLIGTVLFTALFSFVFLALALPFSENAWFEVGFGMTFGYTAIFFLLASAIIIISKMTMYTLRRYPDFTFLRYIIWNAAEILLICLLYTVFTIEGDIFGIIDIEEQSFSAIFFRSLAYITIALGIPYVIAGQYFAINDKNNTIRLMNMSSVVGDLPSSPQEEKRITLFDNSGVLKFSTNSSNLYFIESDDNYIQVWYKDNNGEMKQYMLRCKLKTIEDSFTGSELVRCHRKYIVNITKVRTLTAEKDGYCIDLDIPSVAPIPVSKTYEETVLSRFNSR
ncbi:MAG: LytTR family transcriptional regulator [Bacteroidales bacterium]|nr:LytTR family transcriptional regulator [Bacteroidales bacterium]